MRVIASNDFIWKIHLNRINSPFRVSVPDPVPDPVPVPVPVPVASWRLELGMREKKMRMWGWDDLAGWREVVVREGVHLREIQDSTLIGNDKSLYWNGNQLLQNPIRINSLRQIDILSCVGQRGDARTSLYSSSR